MDINYHYYTIRTLAAAAGFTEKEAQRIAFFSQQIDDYVMGGYLVIDVEPPAFFMENGLANSVGNGKWMFRSCSTGINMIRSVSNGYQRHTLVPFHFISPKPLNRLELLPILNRARYRCVAADENKAMLINQRIQHALDLIKHERSPKNLTCLGMILHTYADTYAHCNFSGMHGWENEALIVKSHNQFLKASDINPIEIMFFKGVPSIGHGNVGTIPDICADQIEYKMKSKKKSNLDFVVQRDNTEQFSRCSRNILNYLCEAAGRENFSDSQWNELNKKIIKAQYIRSEKDHKAMKESWCRVFPEIKYHYSKDEFFPLKIHLDKNTKEYLLKEKYTEEKIFDAYSAEGDSARSGSVVSVTEVNQEYFDFMEFAYQHVHAVTGEYAAAETRENMTEYCKMAAQQKI